MAFWSDTLLGVPEPKRSYRFLVYVGGFEPWIAKKVTKPSFSISESEHTYINHKFYYPGRVEWNTVDVTFVDPGAPDTTQSVYNILTSAGYVPPANPEDVRTISKAAAVASLGMIRIQTIGDQFSNTGDTTTNPGTPMASGTEVLEEWILYNAWLKEVKFGDLDYSSDDLVEITMTMRYDYAMLNRDNKAGSVQKSPGVFNTKSDLLI
jgi:hypothetical protein